MDSKTDFTELILKLQALDYRVADLEERHEEEDGLKEAKHLEWYKIIPVTVATVAGTALLAFFGALYNFSNAILSAASR